MTAAVSQHLTGAQAGDASRGSAQNGWIGNDFDPISVSVAFVPWSFLGAGRPSDASTGASPRAENSAVQRISPLLLARSASIRTSA